MNQAGYLYQLQKVDTQLDQVNQRLNEIERLLLEDQRIIDAKASADHSRTALERSRQKLRSIEHLVSEQQIKIEQTESTLYSGVVKNPKELQDLQLDLASLKKHLNGLEDQQLEAMIEHEMVEQDESNQRANLARVQAQIIEEKAGLSGEREQLLARRQKLETERSVLIQPVSPEFFHVYTKIREQKRGLAVTSLEDGACIACGAQIRPAEAQAARLQPQLFFCNSCGRIIFAG